MFKEELISQINSYRICLNPLLERKGVIAFSPEGEAFISQWVNSYLTDTDPYGVSREDILNALSHKVLEREARITPKFTFVDLFAGMGGFHLAANCFDGVCVFTSDIDRFAQETYLHNFGIRPFGDITKVKAEEVPSHDVLFAGFPCQPFSYSGKCEGFEDKTKGTLFFDVVRIIKQKLPKVIILENVKGFKSHQSGETMMLALETLKEIGYTTDWAILNSSDFGVPQLRERWYCVAIKAPSDPDVPKLKTIDKILPRPILKDILEDNINDPSLSLSSFEIDRINYHYQVMKEATDRVQHDNSKYDPKTKKGKHGVFSFLKPDGSLRFHVGDFAKTQIQEAFYTSENTQSPTIIANRVPKILEHRRKLSVREALRLQGYPESYKFNISNAQAYKQIGNSITPKVVEMILNHINILKILSAES